MAAIKSRSLVNHVLGLSTVEDEEDEGAHVLAGASFSRRGTDISFFFATAGHSPVSKQ